MILQVIEPTSIKTTRNLQILRRFFINKARINKESMMIDFNIIPFVGVGNLKFGDDRDDINRQILADYSFTTTQNTNVITGEVYTNDHFENGMILCYTQALKLTRIVLAGCSAYFHGKDLTELSYAESFAYLSQFDDAIEEEEYVGFTAYQLDIAIYAPNGTEEPSSPIETVTVAEKGAFELER